VPSGIGRIVWRWPVGKPAPIGGDEETVTGRWREGPMTIGGGWPALA
jgi:hypothetical protein